jgi:hypothetical protein
LALVDGLDDAVGALDFERGAKVHARTRNKDGLGGRFEEAMKNFFDHGV